MAPTFSPLGFPSGLEGIGSIDWEAEYEALAETSNTAASPTSSDAPFALETVGSIDWDAEYEELVESSAHDALAADEAAVPPSSNDHISSTSPDLLMGDALAADEDIFSTTTGPLASDAPAPELSNCGILPDEDMPSTPPGSPTSGASESSERSIDSDEDMSFVSPGSLIAIAAESPGCGILPDDDNSSTPPDSPTSGASESSVYSIDADEATLSTPPGSPTLDEPAGSSECSGLPDDAYEDLTAYANEASDLIEETDVEPSDDWEHPGWTWEETPSTREWTSTSPEVCAWIMSPALVDDMKFIVTAAEEEYYAHNDIPRIAAVLRCALQKIYNVRDTPDLKFPPMARGFKSILREAAGNAPLETYKRGSKGFKSAGDPEIRFLEPFVPLGESTLARNRHPCGNRWYFPQPSRLCYVWNANDDEEDASENSAYVSSPFVTEVAEESGSDGSEKRATYGEESSSDDGSSPIDSMDTSMESIDWCTLFDHKSDDLTRDMKVTIPDSDEEDIKSKSSSSSFIYETDVRFITHHDVAEDDVAEEDNLEEEISTVHFESDPVDGEFDVSDDVFDSMFYEELDAAMDAAFAGDIEYIIKETNAGSDDITSDESSAVIATEHSNTDEHEAEDTDAGSDEITIDEPSAIITTDCSAIITTDKPSALISIECSKAEDHEAEGTDTSSGDISIDELSAIIATYGSEPEDREAKDHDVTSNLPKLADTNPLPILRTPAHSRDALVHDVSPKLTGTGRPRAVSLEAITATPDTPTKPACSVALKGSGSAKKEVPEKTLYQGFYEQHGGVEATVEKKKKSSWKVKASAMVGVVCGVIRGAAMVGSPFMI